MGGKDRQLDKELRFHLESLVEQNIAAGMSPGEARRQAKLAFGGAAQIGEECREIRAFFWLETLWADLRYALRALRGSKAFTAAAVLSLALGIGANTAIFTLLHAALWKPLPLPRPNEIYHVMRTDGETERFGYSWVLFQQLRETLGPYGSLVARGSVGPRKLSVNGGEPERVVGENISSGYFESLGVIPAAGQLPRRADDDQIPAPAVLVLSHAFWTRRFQADPRVIGKTVEYEERQFRIIGVATPGFRGVDAGAATDVWAPTRVANANLIAGGIHTNWLDLLVRMRPGVDLAKAQAAVEARFRRHVMEEIVPDVAPPFAASLRVQHVRLRPAASGFAHDGREYERPLLVLMAVVGIVLLISCANVANLMLARNVARRREIAVRIALGAGRARLACQLIVESILLALTGAALGVGIGGWCCRLLLALLPTSRVPLAFDLNPDTTIIAFTTGLALLTALLCGIAPVWRATRPGAGGLHIDGMRVTGSGFAGRALVAGQLALSLVLVGSAGLFLKTLHNLEATDLGFRPERVVSFELSYGRGSTAEMRAQTARTLLDRLEQTGLRATFAWPSVYSNGGWSSGVTSLDGKAAPAGDNEVQTLNVGPDFLEMLGMQIRAGRGIGPEDDAAAPHIAVVNQYFAHRYFPDGRAVGHRIGIAGGSPLEIVGVIADVRHMGVKGRVWPAVYFPALQHGGLQGDLLIRSALSPATLSDTVRTQLKQVSVKAQVENVTTLQSTVDAMVSRERLVAFLSTAFGILAALLAAIGLYGMMAYNMSRRTAEIGIRMALGARPGDIRRMAVAESLRLILIGLAIGIPAALAAGGLVRGMLYGMQPADPWVLAIAAALMVAVTLAAAWLPARRAAATDPNAALRG